MDQQQSSSLLLGLRITNFCIHQVYIYIIYIYMYVCIDMMIYATGSIQLIESQWQWFHQYLGSMDQWISTTPCNPQPRHRIFCEVDATTQFRTMPSHWQWGFNIIDSDARWCWHIYTSWVLGAKCWGMFHTWFKYGCTTCPSCIFVETSLYFLICSTFNWCQLGAETNWKFRPLWLVTLIPTI